MRQETKTENNLPSVFLRRIIGYMSVISLLDVARSDLYNATQQSNESEI